MRTVTIPVELRIDGEDDAVEVSLLRKDRSDPHRLCFQFSLTKEDIKSARMCFVVYKALRDEMLTVLGRKRTLSRSVSRKKSKRVV